MRPHDQALGQDRAGADVHVTDDYRRAGDLGLGLVKQHLVEAHDVLTVLLAGRPPGPGVPATAQAENPARSVIILSSERAGYRACLLRRVRPDLIIYRCVPVP